MTTNGRMRPTHCRVATHGNTQHPMKRTTAVRVRIPSGARGVAVAYAEVRGWVLLPGKVAQQVERRRVRRSSVRIRPLQIGYSSVGRAQLDAVAAGSIPVIPNCLPAVRTERKFQPRKRPVRCFARRRSDRTRNGHRSDGIAGPTPARRRNGAANASRQGTSRCPAASAPRTARAGSAMTASGAFPTYSVRRSRGE